MAYRYGEGVRGVGLSRYAVVLQKEPHHLPHVLLCGKTEACYGELYDGRRIFKDRHPALGDRKEGRPPCLPQDDGALRVLGEEDRLHRYGVQIGRASCRERV